MNRRTFCTLVFCAVSGAAFTKETEEEEEIKPDLQGDDELGSSGVGGGGDIGGSDPAGASGGGGGIGDIGDACETDADCGTDPQGMELECGPATGCGATPGSKCCR